MGYFDPTWRTELTTDAGPTGIGGVLAQHDPEDPTKRKIKLNASRALKTWSVNILRWNVKPWLQFGPVKD